MKPGPHQDFKKNVFINCPFDGEYKLLLRPILFTIVYFGINDHVTTKYAESVGKFQPRVALWQPWEHAGFFQDATLKELRRGWMIARPSQLLQSCN